MQIKKFIATGLSALMAGATIAGASLAATQLGNFPSFLASTSATASALDAFVVVGKDAKTADVVGAVDLAARLAGLSYTIETVKGSTTIAGFTGLDRDGVQLGLAANGDSLDDTSGTDYNNAFPGGNIIKNFHFTGLKDSTFTWRSTAYDFGEQVSLAGVVIRHDYATSGINGSLTLEVQSGDIIYQYVFDKTLKGTGDINNPNYTYPVNIEMMGEKFSIVGAGSPANQVKMLTGGVGTTDATTAVKHGDYSVYATLGSNNAWAKVVIQDKAGTTVDTLVINEGDTKTSSPASLDVKVIDVRALQDGTVVGVDVVVGPSGQVEKTYDTSADTTSTGTASDRFPGSTDWGIRVASSNFSTAGELTAGHMLEVVHQPTSTQYLKAGQSVKLPKDYAELKLRGYGSDKLATISIDQVTSASVYNSTGDVVGSSLNGLQIVSDIAGTVVANNNNGYDKAAVLVGKQLGTGANPYPVYFAFWDNSNSRWKASDKNVTAVAADTSAQVGNTSSSGSQTNPSNTRLDLQSGAPRNGAIGVLGATSVVTSEFGWVMLNNTGGNSTTYSYKLSYAGAGEKSDYRLNVTVSTQYGLTIGNVTMGDPGNFNIQYAFQNKTNWNTQTVPEFRLGGTAASSESTDVNVTSETARQNVGKSTQDVVDDTGIIIIGPDTNAAADRAKFKVSSRDLTARVTFGSEGGAKTGDSTTYNKVKAVTSAVAKLDTEVTSAEKQKNLVLVGGPCVNKLTAEALGKTYPACGASSGIAENTALVQAVDDAFATGKVALVVAGWEADNTRLATSVLQNYETYLKGVSASKVTVTGTVAAPVVTPETAK